MKTQRFVVTSLLTSFLVLVILSTTSFAKIIYVDSSVGVSGSGGSWGSPFKTIQEAIDDASPLWLICYSPSDRIYVKEGTYFLADELTLNKVVILYGGFPGSGSPTTADRDPDAYPTVIHGNNSVRCLMVTAYSVIDGFTFRNGRAVGNAGAIYIDRPPYTQCNPDLSVTVRHCRFIDNYATVHGGAIYDLRSNAKIENCYFSGNSADNGGAIKQWETTSTISECIFDGNESTSGGYGGGAILGDYYVYGTLTNCLFINNSSASNGGAISYHIGHPTLWNCTFGNNTAATDGGAMYCNTSNPILRNCILWGDGSPLEDEIANYYSSPGATLYYCNIQGGYTGSGSNILSSNPDFVGGSNYRLSPGSPCIDSGTNSGAPSDDLDGNPRPFDGDENGTATTDRGAYEFLPPEIDLVVDSIVFNPASPQIGETVTVTVTVSNQGSSDSGSFWASFYPDRAAAPAVGDPGSIYKYFSSLAAGASGTMVKTYTYTSSGDQRAYAQVDSTGLVTETDETNNVLGPQQVIITDVDLKITSITYSPTSPKVGEPFTITVGFSNLGTTPSGDFYVDWYSDRTTAPAPGNIGNRAQEFSSLGAGASNTLVRNYIYSTEGTYKTYAQIDTDGDVDETDETNNVYGPRTVHAYDGELIGFNIIEETGNASSWFGGDDGSSKRNVGVGESMIFARDTRVTSAGFRFTGPFDYKYSPDGHGHAVTLIMYVRESDGTLIYSAGRGLPASFNGGWAMISFGTGLWFEAGEEYIFTCHLSNGDLNEYSSGVYGRTDNPWPLTKGYSAVVASPATMGTWSHWGVHPWDFNFQMVGDYVEPYPGDLNDDRSVNLLDVHRLAQHWLANDCIMLEWCQKADLNWNSDVQLDDFATLSRYWMHTYHDYDDLNRAAIVSMYSQMSTAAIDSSNGNELKPGSYLIYRTNSGRYGKMIIESLGYDLVFGYVTYNPNGTVYTSKTGLVIHGTYLCDLDLGLETSTNHDFWWKINSIALKNYELVPQNGSRFKLMYRAP